MRKMIPDWVIQITWILASISGGGALWYFLSQHKYHVALWTGYLAVALIVLGVAFHIHNGIIQREKESSQRAEQAYSNKSKIQQPITGDQQEETKKQMPTDNNISLTIDINNESPEKPPSPFPPPGSYLFPPSETLNYRVRQIGDILQIVPQMEYLSNLAKGGPIHSLLFAGGSFFKWEYPNLDFKLVNNTMQTIYITKSIFQIEKSVIDPWPYLVISTEQRQAMSLTLVNEGWGEVINCSVKFNIVSPNGAIAKKEQHQIGQYKYEVEIGRFVESHNIDLFDAFRNEGVDVEELRKENRRMMIVTPDFEKWSRPLGPFKKGRAMVVGEITYSGFTVEGKSNRMTVKFSAPVSLLPPGPGALLPPSKEYNTSFSLTESKYEVIVPVSHVLRPGEPDRFNIRIRAEKSSYHFFRSKLVYSNGQSLVSQPIELRIFVPRSHREKPI